MSAYRDNGDALTIVLRALHDPAPSVRAEACRALALLQDPRVFVPLVQSYGDDDWHVRKAALKALRQLTLLNTQIVPAPEIVTELRDALQHHREFVRAAACAILGHWRSRVAYEDLLHCAVSGKSTPLVDLSASSSPPDGEEEGAFDLGEGTDWDDEESLFGFGSEAEVPLGASDYAYKTEQPQDISGPITAMDQINPDWRGAPEVWSWITDWVTAHGQSMIDRGMMDEWGAPKTAVLPRVEERKVRRARLTSFFEFTEGLEQDPRGERYYETTVQVRCRSREALSDGQRVAIEGGAGPRATPVGILALLAKLRRPMLSEQSAWLADKAAPPLRAGAMALLAVSCQDSEVATLCRLADHEQLAVRLLALRLVPFTNHRDACAKLEEATTDPSPGVRRAALLGLGLMIPPLKRGPCERRPPSIGRPTLGRRRRGFLSIGRRPTRRADLLEPSVGTKELLGNSLASDIDHDARACAFFTLASNGWLSWEDLPLALDSKAEAVRRLAAHTIRTVVDTGISSLPLRTTSDPHDFRWSRNDALHKLRDDSLPKLLAHIDGVSESELIFRLETLAVLDSNVQLPKSPAEPFLDLLVKVRAVLTPRALVIALSALWAARELISVPLEVWLDALGSSDATARKQAQEALDTMPSTWRDHPRACHVKELLRTQLESPEAFRRAPAALGLAALGDPSGVVHLVDLLAVTASADEARTALKGLHERAFDGLAAALRDPRPVVRKHVVELLGELPSANSLVEHVLLEDESPQVQTAAVQLATRGQVEVSLDALILLTDSTHEVVRVEVPKALARHPLPAIVTTLVQLATDENPQVSSAASAELDGMGSSVWAHAAEQGCIAWLSERMDHRSDTVRAKCVRLIAKIEREARGRGQ